MNILTDRVHALAEQVESTHNEVERRLVGVRDQMWSLGISDRGDEGAAAEYIALERDARALENLLGALRNAHQLSRSGYRRTAPNGVATW